MANTFHLDLVTPDRAVVREDVEELVVPTLNGSVGILAGHAPLLALLAPGEAAYRRGSSTQYLALTGGYVEVLPERVTVLAVTAEGPHEIDVERARSSREKAEKAITTLSRTPPPEGAEDPEFREAEARLHRAVVRLQVAKRGHPPPGDPASGD